MFESLSASFRVPFDTTTTGASAVETAPAHAAAYEAMRTLHDLGRAETELIAAQARLLAFMKDRETHLDEGHSTFGDFVREVFVMAPGTARDRIALHRILTARPGVRRAVVDGFVTQCQVLVLGSVLNEDNEAHWIARCGCLSVRELQEEIDREAGEAGSAPAVARSAEFIPVSFPAPVLAQVAWDGAMETARRVLGWDAPQYACVEAVLAEAAGEVDSNQETIVMQSPVRAASLCTRRRRRVKNGYGLDSEGPVDGRLFRTLALARRQLRKISGLIQPEVETDRSRDRRPDEGGARAIERLLRLIQAERPLRVLFGQLLFDLSETRLIRRLGYRRISDFVQEHLHLSERAGRDRLREAELFRAFPELREAYRDGRISLGQIHAIRWSVPRNRLAPMIRRAARTTHRQFVDEIRLLKRLAAWNPGLAARCPGPLPDRKLERMLTDHLLAHGWSRRELDRELKARQIAPVDGEKQDPAANAILMKRLEVLLEWAIVGEAREVARALDRQTSDNDTAPGPREADRQTSDNDTAPGPREADRQTSEGPLYFQQPAALRTIRFSAPAETVAFWTAAIDAVRTETQNPALPTWAAALILAHRAVREWQRHDPERLPVAARILERDGWRCRAPGCSSRRRLQVHHLTFRSRGGTDHAWNRVSLCYEHHQLALHQRGGLAVSGRAPRDLRWTLGRGATKSVLSGDLYESRPGVSVEA